MPTKPKVKRPPRPDEDIAKEIIRKFRAHAEVPAERITVNVAQGFVIIEGTVSWPSQKRAAQSCVIKVRGVRVLENRLRLEPNSSAAAH